MQNNETYIIRQLGSGFENISHLEKAFSLKSRREQQNSCFLMTVVLSPLTRVKLGFQPKSLNSPLNPWYM